MPKRGRGKRVSEMRSLNRNSEDGEKKKIHISGIKKKNKIQFSDIDSLEKKKEDGKSLFTLSFLRGEKPKGGTKLVSN